MISVDKVKKMTIKKMETKQGLTPNESWMTPSQRGTTTGQKTEKGATNKEVESYAETSKEA